MTSSLVVLSLPMQPSSCSVAIQMLVVMHDISGNIKYTSIFSVMQHYRAVIIVSCGCHMDNAMYWGPHLCLACRARSETKTCRSRRSMQLQVIGLKRVQMRMVSMCTTELQLAAAIRDCYGRKLLAYLL